MAEKLDSLERISRWITLGVFLGGILVFSISPLMAISWRNKPFPGFLTEHTLLVTGNNGDVWPGKMAGMGFHEKVTRISGQEVSDTLVMQLIFSQSNIGDQVSIITELENGSRQLYPEVPLIRFPRQDFIRLFWVPYFIGFIYLAIGIWIYLIKGQTRPGRALAFFCGTTAITTGSIFDLVTTHRLVPVWLAALSLTGGALTSLAMRFPVEWRLVKRHSWALAVPYLVSLLLTLSGWMDFYFSRNAWSYPQAWGIIYRYTAFGILFFLAMAAYQYRISKSRLIRQQSRIVLMGGFIAFLPINIYFLSPLFNIQLIFYAILYLPTLVIFPLAVTVAVMRYRLLEVDKIVNSTLVYTTLTAILAGLFTTIVVFMRFAFVAITGEKSDMALVITTFVVASAVVPIKNRLQKFVDSQFVRAEKDPVELKQFGDQVLWYLQLSDPEKVTQRFLEETVQSLDASTARLIYYQNGHPALVHTFGNWKGNTISSIPLEFNGEAMGLLLLGPPEKRKHYTEQEIETVKQVSQYVSQAVHHFLAYHMKNHYHDSGGNSVVPEKIFNDLSGHEDGHLGN